jgi:S-formylglutathione hydrolase FrmB
MSVRMATRWRRRFAVALVLAAAAAGARPAPAQQRGTVTVDYFRSDALGVRKDYLVYLPPSYRTDPTRRFPVAYYLHGALGSEDDWAQKGGIDVVMDSLTAAGMPEMIVVMPDGDDGYYTDWATAYNRKLCPLRPDLREPAARYCVRAPRYDAYIARDLVRHIDATYRTAADARHRGIAGLSMGGFGALALAVEYPGVWAAAASHSGAVELLALSVDTVSGAVTYAAEPDTVGASWARRRTVFGPDTADWWRRDPAGRIRRLDAEQRQRLPALYVDVGTADQFLVNNRALRADLIRLEVPLEYHEYPGTHDWAYWRAHVAQSLVWLSRHFAP